MSSTSESAPSRSSESAFSRVRQVEISEPIPPLSASSEALLVRLWGRPLGFTYVAMPASADEIAAAIWRDLRPAIQRALLEGGLPLLTSLSTSGVPTGEATWKRDRSRVEQHGPPATVVLCTRNRPEMLARALRSLAGVVYHNIEIIVVDNAPGDDRTRLVVEQHAETMPHPLRYLREQRPGLSWARNAGVSYGGGEIIAFMDDDVVVDPIWLAEIVRAFDLAENVGCVTGQVLPFDPDSDVSRWRETYAGATKFGFERKVFDRYTGGTSTLYPFTTGECGSGMNMAFRRASLARIGGFATALGAGTPCRGGEDLAAFFGVMNAGERLVYEPGALASHAHRSRYDDLELQMTGWGSGLTAYLTHLVASDPKQAGRLVLRSAAGLRTAVSPTSRKNRRKPPDYPVTLTHAELRAMPTGPWRYVRGRHQSHRIARGLAP